MKKCIYLTEGECEEKLVKALKEKPSLIVPGKVWKFNVIQNVLPTNKLMQFEPGSMAVLVFDTDKPETDIFRENIALLKALHFKVEIVTVLQVLSFEDEIVRATDVVRAQDLTRSRTVDDFKSAVNRMKERDFRSTLARHKLDIGKLWSQKPPQGFGFVQQGAEKIKSKPPAKPVVCTVPSRHITGERLKTRRKV